MSHLKLSLSFLLMIVLTACNSGGGGGGVQTVGGGTNAVAARSAPLASGDTDCPTGGVLVETGIDENGNGVLDTDEVDKAEKICNGASGLQSLILLSDEDIGANCPVGGVRVDTGIDGDGNGILDAAEITDTKFVCNPGRDRLFETKEKLNAFDAIAGARFGFSVAISGDYAIVGASQDPGGLVNAGAAYIFRRTGPNTWDAGEKIVSPDQADNDRFGFSVSISGDYAIVGAYLEDHDLGAGNLNQAGAAYIFRRTDTNTWDAGTKIVASDGEIDDRFGRTVAISGDYAIVGAIRKDLDLGTSVVFNVGAAYVFRRMVDNTWDTGTKLSSLAPYPSGKFGDSVAISGDYAVVGAGGERTDNLASSGAAYIFKRTGDNTWDSVTKIKALVPSFVARFGGGLGSSFGESSVAISGDYALVGASGEKIGTEGTIGAAYVFKRTGDNIWDLGVKIVAPDGVAGDQFGRSVAISGNIAIVGAVTASTEGKTNAGAAYVFQRTGTNAWDAGTKAIAPAPEDFDVFGQSVAISGNTAIVGAWGENFSGSSDAGTAYIVR